MKQLLILLFCAFAYKGFAQSSADSSQVATTMNSFVDAFSNLKWDKFSAFFADDATAFFPPSARNPYRANNKQEILWLILHLHASGVALQ